MSFESFLHIYLRHVKELAVENQFGERSKFQMAEKDLKATMDIVLEKILFYLNFRAQGGLELDCILYSNEFGLLGESANSRRKLAECQK